jgi:hypothetical protein
MRSQQQWAELIATKGSNLFLILLLFKGQTVSNDKKDVKQKRIRRQTKNMYSQNRSTAKMDKVVDKNICMYSQTGRRQK